MREAKSILNLLLPMILIFIFAVGCQQDPVSPNNNVTESQSAGVLDIRALSIDVKPNSLNKLISITQNVTVKNGGTLTLEYGTPGTSSEQFTILLVVRGSNLPLLYDQDVAKKALLESFGFNVNIIGDTDTQAAFDMAIANSDAAYISEKIRAHILADKLYDAPIGVVCEEPEHTYDFGFSSSYSVFSGSSLSITDNTHFITYPFELGSIQFLSSASSNLISASGSTSNEVSPLAYSVSNGYPALLAIEKNSLMWNNQAAPGRRVKLPWGKYGFDINLLNENGKTLLHRALQWASQIELTYLKSTLEILPRTIKKNTEISLEIETTELAGGVAVEFKPHGTVFSQPALLSLEVYGVDFTGINPDAVDIFYDNPETGLWEPMDKESLTINADAGYLEVINAELPHFSRYAIGLE